MCQFNPPQGKTGLGSMYKFPRDVYPVGRLDEDSEGLLIITNDKYVTTKLLDPVFAHKRTYWVQVDGQITKEACAAMEKGLDIKVNDKVHHTLPAKVKMLDNPVVPERVPPIRFRKNIPTSWVELTLTEGKNRQVRKMTAATGFPTLRLIRVSIEELKTGKMQPGSVLELEQSIVYQKLKLQIK